MLSSSTLFLGQHGCMSIHARGRYGEVYSKMKPDTFHVAVANHHDSVLRGYQGGWHGERQLLHQVQGSQAQVRGPDLRQTPTPPPCRSRRRRQRRRRHPRHQDGRGRSSSIQREGAFTDPSPAARGKREGVVKRLLARPKADAD